MITTASGMLVCGGNAARFGTMAAAIDRAVGFDAVPNDVAIAVGTLGRQCVDRALEAVERMALALGNNLERFVIIVSANFAACHGSSSSQNQTQFGDRARRPSSLYASRMPRWNRIRRKFV
jgi:hypothetical protein